MKYKQNIEALELMFNEMGKQGQQNALSVSNVQQAESSMVDKIIMKQEINY